MVCSEEPLHVSTRYAGEKGSFLSEIQIGRGKGGWLNLPTELNGIVIQ